MNSKKIKDAVNSIEMSKTMKSRVIENCNSVEKEKNTHFNTRRWISIACIFTIVLSIRMFIPSINKGGLQGTNFVIAAYAIDDDGNELKTNLSSEGVIFELSTQERMNVVERIRGNGVNLVFTDIMLNITGEDIDSIEYTTNKGKFIEDIIFSKEERADEDWILSEKIYIFYSDPALEIYQGIKEIGNTYTLKYNEQDKYQYRLAIPYKAGGIIDDDIIINVNVKYTDGKIEQQDIIVTQENDSISLRLK